MEKTRTALSVALLTMGSLVFGGLPAMAATDSTLVASETIIGPSKTSSDITAVDGDVVPAGGCIVKTYHDLYANGGAGDITTVAEVGFGEGGDIAFNEYVDQVTWTSEMLGMDGNFYKWAAYFEIDCASVTDQIPDTQVTVTLDSEEPGTLAKPTVSAITATTATVSWTAATGGGAVTKYEVYLGSTKQGEVLSSAALTYNLTGLTANTAYTVKVVAVNANGTSENSETFTTLTSDATFAKPTISNIAPTVATVTWTAASGTGVTVTKYEVYLGDTKVVEVLPSATLSHKLTGLKPDTSYTVKVKAITSGTPIENSETFKTTVATKSTEIKLAAKVGEVIAGTKVTVTASGLKPGASYTVVLKSDPVTLASGTVPDSGSISTEATIPASLAAGEHTITLTSTDWEDKAVQSVLSFTLDADGKITEIKATEQSLAATGLGLILPFGIALALAGVGAGFLINGARRKGLVNA
jgi:hypothetical protein